MIVASGFDDLPSYHICSRSWWKMNDGNVANPHCTICAMGHGNANPSTGESQCHLRPMAISRANQRAENEQSKHNENRLLVCWWHHWHLMPVALSGFDVISSPTSINTLPACLFPPFLCTPSQRLTTCDQDVSSTFPQSTKLLYQQSCLQQSLSTIVPSAPTTLPLRSEITSKTEPPCRKTPSTPRPMVSLCHIRINHRESARTGLFSYKTSTSSTSSPTLIASEFPSVLSMQRAEELTESSNVPTPSTTSVPPIS